MGCEFVRVFGDFREEGNDDGTNVSVKEAARFLKKFAPWLRPEPYDSGPAALRHCK
jgi:hypothetical protein